MNLDFSRIAGATASTGLGFATGGLAGAAAGFLSYASQASANASNVALSQRQMDFQERMSSTAHQREVADLRAAGLNPILSGTGGAGASSPSGSLGRVESAAGNVQRDAAQASLLKAQVEKTWWEAAAAREGAALNRRTADLRVEEARSVLEARGGITYDNMIKGLNVNTALSQQQQAAIATEMRQIELDIERAAKAGKVDQAKMLGERWYQLKRRLDAGLESVGSAAGAAAKVVAPVAAARGAKAFGKLLPEIRRIQRPVIIQPRPLK